LGRVVLLPSTSASFNDEYCWERTGDEKGTDGNRYLIEKYDKKNRMMGGNDEAKRNRIRTFVHAAEGTFLIHALAVTYARWFSPESVKSSGELKELEKGLAINVGKDLGWLDAELEGKKFISGDSVSAADTMCLFSVQFIFARDLCAGRKVGEWRNVERWIKECESTGSWKRAVKKTGHEM
jgi:glutathione S-transferase